MLEFLYRPLIILHIVTGTIAMFASILAFALPKYGKAHKLVGNIFFWCMLITSVGSMPPAVHSEKWFLLLLGVFSFHMTYTGKRYLFFRRRGEPALFDKVMAGGIAIFGLFIIILGVPGFYRYMGITGVIAPAFFGLICVLMGREDFHWFKSKDNTPKLALRRHISRMGGASIAAFTAFLVNVDLHIDKGLMWIIPSVIGSIFMAYFMRKVRLGQPMR